MCFRNALDKSVEEFAEKDPAFMAEMGGAVYHAGVNKFKIEYCGIPCRVTYPGGEVTVPEGHQPVTTEERILFLQYLAWASSLPPRNRWLSFIELPGGSHHYDPFKREAIYPLAERYGNEIEGFISAGLKYGGRLADMGDAGIFINPLPRIPMAYIVWKPTEELDSRANILFDAVSPTYLPTASLYVLGIQVAKRIWLR